MCSVLAWWVVGEACNRLVGGSVIRNWWACRCARLDTGGCQRLGDTVPRCLPAREPEAAVLEQLRSILRARDMAVADWSWPVGSIWTRP